MDARRLTIVAVLLAACYVVLGLAVSPAPPGRLDVAAEALRGYGVPAALFFTRAGQFPVYAGVCVLLLIAGAFRRAWLGRVGLAVATLLCAWVSSDLGKAFFHRPRPVGWIGIHETSYSYARRTRRSRWPSTASGRAACGRAARARRADGGAGGAVRADRRDRLVAARARGPLCHRRARRLPPRRRVAVPRAGRSQPAGRPPGILRRPIGVTEVIAGSPCRRSTLGAAREPKGKNTP